MPRIIECTLVTDGSSDKMLIAPVSWCLEQLFPEHVVSIQFADLRQHIGKDRSLSTRITLGLNLYPCDLLFIHRDAEGETYEDRLTEINEAVAQAGTIDVPFVPVIPVRMSEAWLLHDAKAIRTAAGNPNGSMNLSLPFAGQVHKLSDPKAVLEELLIIATGNNKRRRKKFQPRREMHRIAELISDFSVLQADPSFQKLQAALEEFRFTLFL